MSKLSLYEFNYGGWIVIVGIRVSCQGIHYANDGPHKYTSVSSRGSVLCSKCFFSWPSNASASCELYPRSAGSRRLSILKWLPENSDYASKHYEKCSNLWPPSTGCRTASISLCRSIRAVDWCLPTHYIMSKFTNYSSLFSGGLKPGFRQLRNSSKLSFQSAFSSESSMRASTQRLLGTHTKTSKYKYDYIQVFMSVHRSRYS